MSERMAGDFWREHKAVVVDNEGDTGAMSGRFAGVRSGRKANVSGGIENGRDPGAMSGCEAGIGRRWSTGVENERTGDVAGG